MIIFIINKLQNMVDKYSAPAFSIGGALKTAIKQSQPGPGAYDTISYLKNISQSKSYKLSSQKRFTSYATEVPGPGSYSKDKKQHIATTTILSRAKQPKQFDVPGPGAYNPDYHQIVKSHSSYKIGLSDRQSELDRKNPGPGYYQSKTTLLGVDHANKFGSDKRSDIILNKNNPGPCSYDPNGYFNGSVSSNPKVKFGKSSRSSSVVNLVPGPGNYQVKDFFQESIDKKKGFSLKFRKSQNNDEAKQQPGPGSYENEHWTSKTIKPPSFSISKSPKLKLDNERQILSKPNQYTYNTNISTFDKRGLPFSHDKRKAINQPSIVPGPGAYNPQEKLGQPKFSIPKDHSSSMIKKSLIPGPGAYDPHPVFNSQYEGIGINIDQRKPFYNQKHGIPGPGEYNYQLKNNHGYTIGHQKRKGLVSSNVPGPGNYNIPTTLSNLPHYAISDSK